MRVGCVCPTYKRPDLLGRAIYCFLQQTHTDSYLVVLDDAGQYKSQEHERWKLVSTAQRYNSLGGKRQAGISMLPSDCKAYMAWDDDDVYFPEAIAHVAEALQLAPWAQCRLVYETAGSKDLRELQATEAFRVYKSHPTKMTWGYGGCWGYRLSEHRAVGGYDDNPARSSNDDLDLAHAFYRAYGESANSTSDGKAWYWYNRDPQVSKISIEGVDFWQKREAIPVKQVNSLCIGWNGQDVYKYTILPGIQPRPF